MKLPWRGFDRIFKQCQIGCAGHLNRPEAGQMPGDELSVEQPEPARTQTGHQMTQRDL